MLCEDWCTVADVIGDGGSGGTCAPCAPSGDDPVFDEDTVAEAIALASEVLYGLTGEQFGGLCTQEIRPCARRRCTTSGRRHTWTQPHGSAWNGATCACGDDRPCGCRRLPRVELPAWPVVAIVQVVLDGVVLDPAEYRLDESRWLTRLDGQGWPACQDLLLASTEVDTFSVTFLAGAEVPPGGRVVAARYACEIARSWCGQECELPTRVTSITRQGVAYTFDSAADLTSDGRTGIATVDLWVRSVNGGDGQLQTPALIASPDSYAVAYRPGG